MALTINLSREDVLTGNILPPGWYLATIKDAYQKAATTDGSTNTWFKFVIAEGEHKDTPVLKNFSEKFMAPIVGLIEILSGKKYVPGTDVNLEGAIGKQIRIQVQNKLFNGNPQNEIVGFKAA